MNRFIICDGLPYLLACGRAYAVRWDSTGFTVGNAVDISVDLDTPTYSEISIKAKCSDLDSIKGVKLNKEAEPKQKRKAVKS